MDAVTRRQLGVCYFPEHWDPADWLADAAEMRALGIDFVRIASVRVGFRVFARMGVWLSGPSLR